MTLSIIVPGLNQNVMFKATYQQLASVTIGAEILLIDNGSAIPLSGADFPGARILRNESTIGVYPVFEQGIATVSGDIVAFFHNDFVIWEHGWDRRVLKEFSLRPRLGMIGFVGSDEIDSSGGRGHGTTSNFQGKTLKRVGREWNTSPAAAHGKQSAGFSNAATVDGCAIILRRAAWNEIGYRKDFPPNHFYDKLISTQLAEKNWQIGVLGIECDHISGQTSNGEKEHHDFARAWCLTRGITPPPGGEDRCLYLEAERRWLDEYREQKHVIPRKVPVEWQD